MGKALRNKAILCTLLAVMLITLLQGFSLAASAESEKIQIMKKSETEYMVYVDGLLDQDFDFAFSNENSETAKENLVFHDAALDQEENGNHIAYVEGDLYKDYFEGKKNTYLWTKQETEQGAKVTFVQEIKLAKALTEADIAAMNRLTKTIDVTVGEKDLPTETKNGVEITHKIGTINITNKEGNYSYKIVEVAKETDAEAFVTLVKEMNQIDGKNVFVQLAKYNEFKAAYAKVMPKAETVKESVVDATIEQPENSKEGDQYLVWIKNNDTSEMDVQIMTCKYNYTENTEKQEVVIKTTTKLPITGDNIVLFVIAGIILILIIAVIVLKLRSKKDNK